MPATIREAFRTKIAGDVTVAGYVGTRIAPVRNKQRDGQPSIAYQVLGGRSPLHLAGKSNPQTITFRVDCFALTELDAAAIGKAVRDAVDGVFSVSWSGIAIQGVSVRDASDNPTDPVDGSDVGIYCESLDVRVLYAG